MFKKQDYLEYFKEIYEIELDMEKEALKLIDLIKDDEIMELLTKLRDDELRHAKLVKELIALI